jgi:outer membrane protein
MTGVIERSLILTAALAIAAAAHGQSLRVDADTAARMAVDASSLVVAADARLAASESGVAAADAMRWPIVGSFAAVNQRSAVPELSVPIGGPGTPPQTIFPNIETTYLAELAVTQPLYAGGAIEAGRRAARHQLDATTSARRRTVLDLRYAARSAYWLAVAADAGLDSAQAEQRRALRLLDDANALHDAGMAVTADVLAAEARAAAAKVEVIRAETEVGDTRARLRSLLAVPAGTRIELVDIETSAVPPPPPSEGALQSEAIAARPELAELDARVAALKARAQSIDAGRKPTVAVGGAWDLARPNPRFLPLEDAWNNSWSVGVTAGWTLFNAGRTRSSAAAVRSEGEALLADRGEAERQVRLEVETARLTLVAALDAVVAADASLAAARARETAASERYQAGLAQIWEMLDAQAELANAERVRIRSGATAWIAAAALDRSVGR